MGKNFKENLIPAMQFISEPPAEPVRRSEPVSPPESQPIIIARKRTAISYVETKSRRLQILIKPSTYDRLAARAASERISVNEMINILIDSQV